MIFDVVIQIFCLIEIGNEPVCLQIPLPEIISGEVCILLQRGSGRSFKPLMLEGCRGYWEIYYDLHSLFVDGFN